MKIILEELCKIDSKISALDTLNDIELDLLGLAEIALALLSFKEVEHSFAVISDLIYFDAKRLRRVVDALEIKEV